ncbi:MAG: hypothetical protein Q7S86_03705 [bacterium]|nr:hypothetical protein [bacterium]
MKSWKHWPYWLRGGVIGGTVEVLFSGFLGEACNSLGCLIGSYGPLIFVLKLLEFMSVPVVDFDFSSFSVLGRVLIFLTWFLYGAVIGLLVGYIKSKRKSSIPQV